MQFLFTEGILNFFEGRTGVDLMKKEDYFRWKGYIEKGPAMGRILCFSWYIFNTKQDTQGILSTVNSNG